MKNTTDIRKIRILVDHNGVLRRVCKFAFTQTDASMYIFPYAVQGKFFYGSNTLPEMQVQNTFNLTEGISEDLMPKLSIHETGQVHVDASSERAGPLFIPPLTSLRGQHIATVCPDAFDALPLFTGVPRIVGSEIEHVIPAGRGVNSGRLALYVNGEKPLFGVSACRLTIRLIRETIPKPLYIGIKPISQLPVGIKIQEGVTVISGWNPNVSTIKLISSISEANKTRQKF